MLEDLARALHLSRGVYYTIILGMMLLGALMLGFALNRILHHWTKKFRNTWGEMVFALLESLPVPLLLLLSLYTGLESLTLPRKYDRLGSKLILTLVILVIFYFPAKVLGLFLRRMSQRNPAMERITQPTTFLVRVLFALLAVIIVLENLGVSLTAVWTTLGVGSVAVALALQETLSNLFAGLYIMADRPVSPGDYIKLDSGQEGFVMRIGWRSATLRTMQNNFIVVPNSTMAKAIITNYSLPEPQMALPIQVGVAYGSDTGKVERVLLEVAREATHDGLEGLIADPPPVVRLNPGFGDSSLDFTLIVRISQFKDQFLVQSELRKRILERFPKEGIEIPFPTRTLVLDQSALEALQPSTVKSDLKNS